MQSVTIIIANAYIARTPEAKQTPSGTTLLKFSLPVNDKEGGQETTTWYEVTVWGKQAESLIALRDRGLFDKGASVFVQGRFKVRSYTGRDGTPKFSNDVNANDVLLLSPPKGYQSEDHGTQLPEPSVNLNDVPF